MIDGLKQGWVKVALAMQAKSATQNGNAIISISVIIDKHGNPLVWTEPSRKFISPRNHPTDWIKDILTGE